jgi:hypothetical protein
MRTPCRDTIRIDEKSHRRVMPRTRVTPRNKPVPRIRTVFEKGNIVVGLETTKWTYSALIRQFGLV